MTILVIHHSRNQNVFVEEILLDKGYHPLDSNIVLPHILFQIILGNLTDVQLLFTKSIAESETLSQNGNCAATYSNIQSK